MDLFHSNGYLDIFSERSKFSKKIAMLKKILGMLRTKIERKSAPMKEGLRDCVPHRVRYFLAVDWLKFKTLPRKYRSLICEKHLRYW